MGLNHLIEHFALILDLPFEQLNLFMCLLITFPIAYINRFIESPRIRLIYGLVTGILIQFQMYGESILHIIVATTNTFLFIKYLGRKISSLYVIFFNICHLSFLHLRNMFTHYEKWTLGIETCYMMSICKFSSIAFNYEDGGKEETELKSQYQKDKLIKEKPTLLETFSFIFYFPTSLIGPSFEFSDFRKFINREDEYKNIPWKKANKEALKDFVQVIILLCLKLKLSKYFNTKHCGTEKFQLEPMWYKYIYMALSMIVMRSTYYLAWKFTQSLCNMTGLSYNNKDKFDKIDSCNLQKIELDLNPRIRIQYWNRTVHLWLKYYVYLRIINLPIRPFKNNKGMASLITFLTSAIWHGFYLTYYVFFVQYYMIEQIALFLEERFNLFLKIEKETGFITQFFYRILLMIIVNYFGLSFSLLSFQENLNYHKAFNYVPISLLVSAFFITLVYPKNKKKLAKSE